MCVNPRWERSSKVRGLDKSIVCLLTPSHIPMRRLRGEGTPFASLPLHVGTYYIQMTKTVVEPLRRSGHIAGVKLMSYIT